MNDDDDNDVIIDDHYDHDILIFIIQSFYCIAGQRL
jgi:hypothetical protein